MRKALLLSIFLIACNHNTPTPANPYAIARAIVQGAQIAVTVADAYFSIWAQNSSDPASVPTVQAEYNQIKMDVINAIQVAFSAINLAEDQSQGIDVTKLMTDAEAAWQKLYTFLQGLGVKVPTSMSVKIKTQKHLVTINYIPKTLLPQNK